jgi:hypothetical protein
MTDQLPPTFAATRYSLHCVAEHVLAAVLHRSTGRIGLRPTPGGFGTPRFQRHGVDVHVRIEGTELVVSEGGNERRAGLHSLAQAAGFVGVEPGGPADVYELVTPLDLDADLTVDAEAAAIIHDFFARTAHALDQFRSTHADLAPSIAQLWPEHFDLAMGMADVNYGGSPGDAGHNAPYAYVGTWQTDELTGEFWNAPFGASRSHVDLATPAAVVEFFETGRQLAAKR